MIRIVKWTWLAFCLAVLLSQAGLFGYFHIYARTVVPEIPRLPETTYLLTESGEVFAALHGPVNRTPVDIDTLPRELIDAVIAAEDKDFYEEGGISVPGILRAAITNIRERNLEQGGSTITQQYVKNRITGAEPTFSRKIREAVLAEKLARRYSKNDILEEYLNSVYLGEGAYGVQAAAQRYFGIDAGELSLAQAATLAGIIPAPERFDPLDHPDTARRRRDLVLDSMVRLGFISEQRAELVREVPILTFPRPPEAPRGTGYFFGHVRRYLQDVFGTDATFEGGLRATVTIDAEMQHAAAEAVRDRLPRGGPDAALVAIDPETGYIRALYGGRNFRRTPFNLATQGRRQTGSAAKVFTLVAALEKNISLDSVWSGPGSTVITDPRCAGFGGAPWTVGNYSDSGVGTMSLRDATVYSVNTIFARLVTVVGPQTVANVARRMGLRLTPLEAVCSITLGSQAVTPLEMTSAFATLASGGIYHEPLPVSSVTNSRGRELLRRDQDGKRVLKRRIAADATSVLTEVVGRGTGTAAQISHPAAGKTGTAQNHQDAWFCGYVRRLAACVWMGYRRGQVPMTNVGGFPYVYGGSLPALIWRDFMKVALAGEPKRKLILPKPPEPPEPLGIDPDYPSVPATPAPSPTVTPAPAPTPVPSPSDGEEPPAFPTPPPEPTPTGRRED